jgi:hypothetical protein
MAAKKTARGKTKTSTRTPGLPTAVAKQALDESTRRIKKLSRDIQRNVHAIGKQLAKVQALELFKARGYESLVDYAAKECGLGPTQTYQFMRIADAFSEDVCATFGVEKLDTALRYIALTQEDESPKDVPDLKIPVKANGRTIQKDFADVTVAELRAAHGKAQKQEEGRPLARQLAESGRGSQQGPRRRGRKSGCPSRPRRRPRDRSLHRGRHRRRPPTSREDGAPRRPAQARLGHISREVPLCS